MSNHHAEHIAYRLSLLDQGGTERLRTSVHAQRRRLMSQGMTETAARQWVEALGFKVGTEPWEDA